MDDVTDPPSDTAHGDGSASGGDPADDIGGAPDDTPMDPATARATVEELLTDHLPGLRAYVRLKAGLLTHARDGESDVVQSTCRAVLEQAANFQHQGEGRFRRWLYTTALRKILDKHDFNTAARRDARREAGGADAELLAVYRDFCTPSRVASAHEQLDRVEQAFAALEEDQREVVLLSRIMGLSRAEVADAMGRSEASVRGLLHRTLTRLSRELQD